MMPELNYVKIDSMVPLRQVVHVLWPGVDQAPKQMCQVCLVTTNNDRIPGASRHIPTRRSFGLCTDVYSCALQLACSLIITPH
jgi:hypothetical protein